MNETKPRLCYVVSSPLTAKAFLENHFPILSEKFDLYLVVNLQDDFFEEYSNPYLKEVKHIPIYRRIHFFKDIYALVLLILYMFPRKFTIVNSFTPKASLLGMLSSWFCRVPIRIHFFTGQVWHTKHGLMKALLMFLDRVTVLLSNRILVDGIPQRDFLVRNKIISIDRGDVIGKGTISGIDTNIFYPDKDKRDFIREELGYDRKDVVFLFLGRINRDKGILDLVHAFKRLSDEFSFVKLLIVGPDEEAIMTEVSRILSQDAYLYFGHTDRPADYMQACDVFCLPSHREAFGLTVIEASACARTVLCSDTYGLTDAMVDNVTGLRHRVKNPDSIYHSMRLCFDEDARKQYGINGLKYVNDYFRKETLTALWLNYYINLVR